MATTDLHMQVLPRAHGAGQNRQRQGFAHTATLIRTARLEAPNTLLLDNGDFLCGNASEILPESLWKPHHPMIEIMNTLGYDAAAPGNHDFDQGLGFLHAVTGQAAFPFVCANVTHDGPDGAAPLFDEYVILKRAFQDQSGRKQTLRIGITGFLPPNSVAQDMASGGRIVTRDIIEAAHDVVARLQNRGVDLIIALAHTGLGSRRHVPNMENAAIPLAAVEGIDVVVSGHRHQVFPGPDWPKSAVLDPESGTVHGKPVVSAGFWGSHLGLIDLKLEQTNHGWTVATHKVCARPVSARNATGASVALVRPDTEVERIMQPMHKRILTQLAQPLGYSADPLHSFFALAGPSRAVQLIQRAQIWHMRRGLAAGTAAGELPLLSSACAFKSGGYGGPENFTDTPAGPLTMAAIADLYPFPNRLEALQITGAGLRDWLERAASVYNRALPGMVVDLKAPEVPAYLYETVLGVEYAVDLSRPARFDQYGNRTQAQTGRIQSLRYAGRAVQDRDSFILITNSYRTGGGGAYPLGKDWRPVQMPRIGVPEILTAYIRAHPRLATPLDHHWRFAPVPGAAMRFRSAPRALDHVAEMRGSPIRPTGRDAQGYQLFDMKL